MKTPIKYYGGKQNLIKQILPLIPEHTQYVEPFFGGGAIFWAKQKSQHEVINDIDNRIINFWEVCSNGGFIKLQKKIQNTLHSEYYYKQAKNILSKPCKDKIKFAWAFYVNCNLGFSGDMNAGFTFSNFPKNKKYDLKDIIHQRLESVEIFSRDAIELIKLKDNKETFFYFDPPYKGAYAGHYQNKVEVFDRLIEILPELKSKWLLSTYDIPEVQHLYKNYNYKKIKQIISARNEKGKNSRGDKIEVLIYNYEINQQNLF